MSTGRPISSSRKRESRANPWLAADFETTTDPNDCRVWAWGVSRVDNPSDIVIDNTVETFIDFISMSPSVTFFHNLRFDGMFIFDHLLNDGFERIKSRGKPGPGQFKELISDQGKFYSFTVCWRNGVVTEFRDSAKKFPGMSISRIAKTFGLDEAKGIIDYDAPRPVGHVLTEDELKYLRSDVVILAKALQIVKDNGMTKLTVAADSMSEYKRLIGDKAFSTRFPTLSPALDAELRKAYRGGFSYANPVFMKRKTCSGIVLDVNSLYPFIMAKRWLPYGEPEFVSGFVEPTTARPLTIMSVTFTAKLKPKHIPCIQIKGSSMFHPTEYLSDISEPTTLMVTNVDLALYEEHYDMDILIYGGGWRFRATIGLFDEYIEKWSTIKANSTGGLREIAKLHLNSLYGKFGSNPNVTGKYPVLVDGKVKLVLDEPETRDPAYTPIAIFVTSYGRDLTIRAAQTNFDTFAYADTDSLHLLRDTVPNGIEVDPNRMGAWKLEYAFESAIYVRSKVYLEKLPNVEPYCDDVECLERHDFKNAFAGLPDRISNTLSFDDIYNGNVFKGKLIPHVVPGGVVFKDVPYELKM